MPLVNINQFLGMNTKPGASAPLNQGRVLTNCILNKGDICNVPYSKDFTNMDHPPVSDFRVIGQYIKDGFVYIVSIGKEAASELLSIRIAVDLGGPFNFLFIPGINEDSFWQPDTFKLRTVDGVTGSFNARKCNFIQVGNWLYVLGLFGNPESAVLNRPRMIKIRRHILGSFTLPQFIGITPFKNASEFARDSGNITFTGDFGFSLRVYWRDDLSDDFVNYVESTVLKNEEIGVFQSTKIKFKIYVQDGMPAAYPQLPLHGVLTQLRLAYYTKAELEEDYYYAGEVDIPGTAPLEDEFGRYFISPWIEEIEETNTLAEFTDKEVPNPSYHAIMYRQRMYYLNIRSKYWTHGIQVSRVIPDAGQGEAIEANYIEHTLQVPSNDVGDYSGCVEYLGQLVIFREEDAWVITGDIWSQGGVFRNLFPHLGCISTDGGTGCIVLEEVLYFVSKDGIYAYNGQSAPIRISEDIQEYIEDMPPDMYKHVRIGVDARYGLLYFNFFTFAGTVPEYVALVYHYKELNEEGIGQWSVVDWDNKLAQVLPNKTGDLTLERRIIYGLSQGISRVSQLDQGGLLLEYLRRDFRWNSLILDFDDPQRKKHIGLVKLFGDIQSTFDIEYGIAMGEAPGAIVKRNTAIQEQNIRLHTTRFIAFIQSIEGIVTPFRIKGMQMKVDFDGRR